MYLHGGRFIRYTSRELHDAADKLKSRRDEVIGEIHTTISWDALEAAITRASLSWAVRAPGTAKQKVVGKQFARTWQSVADTIAGFENTPRSDWDEQRAALTEEVAKLIRRLNQYIGPRRRPKPGDPETPSDTEPAAGPGGPDPRGPGRRVIKLPHDHPGASQNTD